MRSREYHYGDGWVPNPLQSPVPHGSYVHPAKARAFQRVKQLAKRAALVGAFILLAAFLLAMQFAPSAAERTQITPAPTIEYRAPIVVPEVPNAPPTTMTVEERSELPVGPDGWVIGEGPSKMFPDGFHAESITITPSPDVEVV